MNRTKGTSCAAWILACVLTDWNCSRARETAFLEQTDVFVAGQDGIAEYRIPVLLTSKKGTLLAFCDARVAKGGDPPNNIDLVMKSSSDRGKTWGPLRRLVDYGDGGAADSCGLVDRQTGTIWVFSVYCPEGIGSENAAPGISGSTVTYRAIRSDDDGETWSAPIDLTSMFKKPEWRAGSPGPGRGIQMRNGRLIIPRYFTTGPEYSASFVSYSDDHGTNWHIGNPAEANGKTNECQVAELADGSLLLNMRGTEGNRRKTARSSDGGITWSAVMEDPSLTEPRCQASLASFTDTTTQDRDRLLFANPANTRRTNMTVRLSYDSGHTWAAARELHGGPAAYSCLTVLPDLTAGCLYERGNTSPYEKITFARFNLEWLTNGKDSLRSKPEQR